MYRGIIYVQSTEMEEKYVRFQRFHIQKYVDNNHHLNTKKLISLYILYHIRASDVELVKV